MGISVTHAKTIKDAESMFAQVHPDFIVLDRQLPDGDGMNLCTRLRNDGYPGIILMLTARGEIQDRVQGLNAGADDYLPKPFAWEELSARVDALARRKRDMPNKRSATGEPTLWQTDEKRLRIFGSNGWVDLTPLEYKLAVHLMKAHGEIVSREELLKSVWGFTLLPKTRTVDHFMGRLRKHFETNPDDPRHFITVRGAGYRFTSSPEPGPSG